MQTEQLLRNYEEKITFVPKHASWSKDGKKIVMAFYPDRESSSEIFTINADGTNLQRITNNTWKDIQPCFLLMGAKSVLSLTAILM